MSDDKTEQPTPKRLRDARKRGQVAHSKDVTSTALLVALFACITNSYDSTVRTFMDLLTLPTLFYRVPFRDALPQVLGLTLKAVCMLTLPYLGISIVVGIFANFFQVGPLLAFDSIKPDLKKLNPMDKLKNMFSKKNLIELLKSTLKILFLGILIYLLIKKLIDPMLKAPAAGFFAFLSLVGPVMKTFATNVVFAYVAIAFADFFFQRHNHIQQLRMSKDEVKREYKEMEGDPHIKGKRKQLHREMVQGGGGPTERTKKSSVLVTNPTHYAIALFYDGVTTPLPLVTAKGIGMLAHAMMKAAKEANVPIMQNVPLAHALYDFAEINQYIPSELIEPVAEVLHWVNNLKMEQSEPQWDEGKQELSPAPIVTDTVSGNETNIA